MTDKETAKEAWMEAWLLARGGRELDAVTERTAEERFERWWDRRTD